MKALVMLNPAAGTLAKDSSGDAPEIIRRGFADAGWEVEVRMVEGPDIERIAREAVDGDFDAIVAGGGDGTLNTISNVVVESGKIFGVLPLGTLNHFAKELRISLDLPEAVAQLARGAPRDLPVAEVNGRVFLNFSAIGFHPEVVRHREAQGQARGRGKWPATFLAVIRVLRRLPMLRLRITSADGTLAGKTPSIIVCNNVHQMRVFGVENASVPDRGLLNVYLAGHTSRLGMIGLFVRALFGRLESAKNFDVLALPEFRIDSARRSLRVSIDGEVIDLAPPLHYRIRPRTLRVLAPS